MATWCRSSVTYAAPASKRDGSMFDTVPQGGRPGRFFVTLVQVFPASRVRLICPSLLPVQMSPFSSGDSAIAKSVEPSNVIRLSVVMPPEFC